MRTSLLGGYGWIALCFVVIGVAVSMRADDERWIDLSSENLDGWAPPTGEWFVAGSVAMDPQDSKLLTAKPGSGVLINGPKGRTRNLLSKEKFGDIETHLEFLIPKRSNSGVKFEGLYEIQIFDSYGVQAPKAND